VKRAIEDFCILATDRRAMRRTATQAAGKRTRQDDAAMSESLADCQQLMRSIAPQTVIMLAAIMRDKGAPEMTRLRAAKLILDLACGRPKAERVTINVR
jgi:hypothetical protein